MQFSSLLTTVLIVLKLIDKIDISWWLIVFTTPIIILLKMIFIFFISVLSAFYKS